MKFYFVTPVWGPGHLGLFLDVGLPTLLAPGNLPGLAEPWACRFLIYTRTEDEVRLRDAAAFQHLAALMSVEIRLIPDPITVPHRTMSDCHLDAMRQADADEVAAVFVPPDCVWADGSMARLERIAGSGKSMVHMSGIRLDRDAVVPRLRERLSDDRCVLTIQPRPLVALGLAHLHTIAHSHFWNEHDGGLMPANLYWTVPDEGLALRCFHLHPLMVKSQIRFAPFASTIDDDLALYACPDATGDYVVTDSDEILAFELSGPERIVGADFHKASVSSVAAWAELGTNPRHRLLARHAIRIHSGPMTERLWRPIEEAGARIIAAVSRINRLPTPLLALRYPSVLSWRFYALTLKGSLDSNRYQFWARLIPNVIMGLLRGRRALYAAIFLDHGAPRPWHPRWLLRRSALSALHEVILASDRHVILVGGDTATSAQLERARPSTEVNVIDPKRVAIDLPLAIEHLGKAKADAVIALDFEAMSGKLEHDALMPLLGHGRRFVLMGLAPSLVGPPATLPVGVELRPFGHSGTRFSYRIWHRLGRGRNYVNGSAFRLPLKAAGLLVAPLLLPAAALVSLILNLAGLGLDMLPIGDRRLASAPLADGGAPSTRPLSRPTR
jgi:hypothetical protein